MLCSFIGRFNIFTAKYNMQLYTTTRIHLTDLMLVRRQTKEYILNYFIFIKVKNKQN